MTTKPDTAAGEMGQKISITFLFNGEDYRVKTYPTTLLIDAVLIAIHISGNGSRPDPKEWEVRDKDGVLLEQVRTFEGLGIISSARLFVSLAIGAGAASLPAPLSCDNASGQEVVNVPSSVGSVLIWFCPNPAIQSQVSSCGERL